MIANPQRPLSIIEQLSGAAGGSPMASDIDKILKIPIISPVPENSVSSSGASPIANSLASVAPPTAMTNPTMGPQLLNNIFSAPAANPIPKSGLVPWMVLGPVMKKIREGRGMF